MQVSLKITGYILTKALNTVKKFGLSLSRKYNLAKFVNLKWYNFECKF
jgi:hypothetical protein